jgi:hypothetical protein
MWGLQGSTMNQDVSYPKQKGLSVLVSQGKYEYNRHACLPRHATVQELLNESQWNLVLGVTVKLTHKIEQYWALCMKICPPFSPCTKQFFMAVVWKGTRLGLWISWGSSERSVTRIAATATTSSFVIPFYLQSVSVHSANCVKWRIQWNPFLYEYIHIKKEVSLPHPVEECSITLLIWLLGMRLRN